MCDCSDKNKGFGSDTEKKMIEETYNQIKKELREKFFYGDAAEAAKILKPLRELLFGDTEQTVNQFLSASFFYTNAWIRKHGGLDPDFSTTPYMKEAMKKEFSFIPADIVSEGVDICVDFIYRHEPSIADRGMTMIKTKNVVSDNNLPVEYVVLFRFGNSFFEERKYPEAIEMYKKCLIIKENDVLARFEIAEAQIQMREFAKAKDTVLSAVPFIYDLRDKAKLFRILAFIEVENCRYDIAAALLRHSMRYEPSAAAEQELDYIKTVTNNDFRFTDGMIEKILRDNGMLIW